MPEGARVLDTVDGILESEADRLRRWRDDGESSSVSEVDPPDDFDAVIEDRYTTVAEPYHEILDM